MLSVRSKEDLTCPSADHLKREHKGFFSHKKFLFSVHIFYLHLRRIAFSILSMLNDLRHAPGHD